ncbi:MAG: hypothetical protein Q7S57_01630 [bacterium]|nr:hypothetical protein [bacterium]
MQLRNVRAVVREANPSGLFLVLPIDGEPPLLARMIVDSNATSWHLSDGRPVGAGELLKRVKLGDALEIDGTMELHGRRGYCTEKEYASSPNRFWITPFRVCMRDALSNEESEEQ